MIEAPVIALLSGKTVPFAQGEKSAIAKSAHEGRVQIGFTGINGDEQADPRYHGGPDKALHHYPADHYVHWGATAVGHPLLNQAGAFGENVSTFGVTEGDVCIGDRLRLGTALVEVSQPRQPCWKQARRMEWTTLPKMMVAERKSGWYYRVLEEGTAQSGDMLSLVERQLPDWSVRRVFALLIGGEHKQEPEALPILASMEPLFLGMREYAQELMRSA